MQAPMSGETEKDSPVPPYPRPWNLLLLAGLSLEDPGHRVGAGALGLDFWADEYSLAQAGLCFC